MSGLIRHAGSFQRPLRCRREAAGIGVPSQSSSPWDLRGLELKLAAFIYLFFSFFFFLVGVVGPCGDFAFHQTSFLVDSMSFSLLSPSLLVGGAQNTEYVTDIGVTSVIIKPKLAK